MLVLTAALVVPYFIDWSNYRADFEREAGRILGRQVTVRGDATARLLPFPSVTFSDVEVAGATPGEPAITVETFSMDLELSPFMRGEILIFDMRIVRPRARLAVAEDGTIDWTLRPNTPFDPSHVQLEKLTVTEGVIEVSHAASGRVHRLSELNADISARTLAGPWRIVGSGRIDGQMTALSVMTGAAENGHMRLRIHAEPERHGFILDADGEVSAADGAFAYDGAFKLAARQLEPQVQGQPAPPPAYRVSGKFEIDHTLITVPEFRLETGPLVDPYTADGHAEISLGEAPRFVIRADGAQLRFDDAADAGGGGIDLGRRLAALRAAVMDVPRPVMQGSIELKLPAIVAGDTTVRDVQLSAEPIEEGWRIAALRATLPGRATLDAAGDLDTIDDFGFRGRMLLAVAQPSGFAAWLSDEVDEAIRRLPSAGFDANVELTAERQVLDDLELSLGGARFDGRIENVQPEGQRGRMLVDLSGGRLDLEGVAAFAALFVSSGGDTRLADHDLDFKVKAGPVIVAGLTAETVDTQLRLRDDRLEVDRLAIGGLHGADISATGRLGGIGGTLAGGFEATVLAGDLAPLVREVAERLPAIPLAVQLDRRAAKYPGLLAEAALDISGEIGGTAAARSLKATMIGEAGGSALNLALETDALGSDLAATPLALSFSAVNSEPAALYGLAGLPGLPLGFAGEASLEVSLGGTLADAADTRVIFQGEGMELSFDGKLSAGEDGIGAEGQARLSAPDLEPWLMTAGMSVPGMGLGLPVELAGTLDLRGGLAVLSGLDGAIGGTPVSGDINAEMRDGRPHVTGSIETDTLDLALAAEALFGQAAFDGNGEGWPQVPFQPSARMSVTGELEVNARTLKAGTAATARGARLTARFDKEGLRVFDLSAQVYGGTLAGLFEITNNAGTGLFSGQLTLDGATLGELMPDSGLGGTGSFGAALTANGKSVDAMVASLAGSGTASIASLSVPALRADAFADIIAAADAIGPKIDAVATATFAPDLVSGGRFEAGSAEAAITVAGGIVRAPALRLQRPDAVLSVEPRADVRLWTISATGELEYVPGDEAVAGGNPAVRFSAVGAPGEVAVEYDIEPLAQFLAQRALEKEQARVEAMQAVLLERQRLRREVRYYAYLADERARLAEEARLAREAEAARLAAEEAARRAAQEEEVRRAAEETARRAEAAAAARLAAEEATRLANEAEEAARQAAEAERSASETVQRRQADEDARRPPVTDFLPGVDRQPLGPALPRSNDGAGVFSPRNLNFGQAAGFGTP